MNRTPTHVLLVEDSVGDARLLREMFSTETPGSFVLTHVERLSDALKHLATAPVDILLLDMGLPDGHGVDTVRRAHAAAPEVPLIVLTGRDDEVVAAQAIEAGAQDYLIKGQIETRALPRVLRYAIERHRMQAETDLLRQRQAQLKDEFLSHVSHELRSPLTAIYQFLDILVDGLAGDLNQEQREYLVIALKNCRQLKSMIDDLLEMTVVQSGKARLDLQSTPLQALIVDTVTSLQETAAATDIALSWDLPPQLPNAYADPTRVRQVLIILVDNALKFTPANGAVRVQARVHQTDPRLLLLEVVDSGYGIPSDVIEHIFDRLFQAPNADVSGRSGLGLGLHICKELVERQGGRVWATSVPGNGTTLSFTLPVFSLATLIGPMFTATKSADSAIAVVVTELGSQNGWLSKATIVASSLAVRELLGSCMNSEMDVLLPKMGPAAATELFFIVALTGEIGAEAIAQRIRRKFADTAHVQLQGLTVVASYHVLRSAAKRTHELMEEYVGRISIDIQNIVDEESSPKVANVEQ